MTETAQRNKATALAFFKALEAENPEHVAGLFADHGIHINPYHSDIFPHETRGRDAITAYWTHVFPNFAGMEFPIHEIHAMEHGDMVFVHLAGRIKLQQDAGWYENDYYTTFKFNEQGEIIEYVEIFNPIIAARAFGLMEQLVPSAQP